MSEISVAIAFALLKGGVGKTTSAVGLGVNLGMAAGQLGPVLFVDGDPQATATTSRANLVRRLNAELTREVEERRGGVTHEDMANLATFGNVYPYSHTQIAHPDPGSDVFASRQEVTAQLNAFTDGIYQPIVLPPPTWAGEPPQDQPIAPKIMVIDTSPAFPGLLDGVLDFMAQQPRSIIIVPTSMDDYDLGQARQFPELLRRSSASQVPYAILATKVDGRRKEHKEHIKALRRADYPMLDTVVPYGAPFQRGPLWDYNKPKSPFNRVYKAIAAEAIRMATAPRTEPVAVGE